jgi:transglutaminase-like putative cysteine protease
MLVSPVADGRRVPTESVHALIEFERRVMDVEASGRLSTVEEKQILIQSEVGRERESVQHFQYIGRENRLKVLEAYTTTPDGQKIPVERSAIEDKETAESSQGFDSVRTVFVSFPRVTPGARLYYRVRHEVNEVPFPGVFGTMAVVEGRSADQFRIEINSSLPLFFSENDSSDLLEVRSEALSPQRWRVVIENRRPIRLEIDQEDGAVYPVEKAHAVVVSSERDWAKMIRSVQEEFDARLADPLPEALSALLKRAQADRPPLPDDIESLLVAIASEFRYFGDWRHRKGGFFPRSLREIAETRYGDCKDLSLLVARILRSWGLEAEIALVFRGEQPLGQWAYALPSGMAFNHAIVRLKFNGRTIWIDPTLPIVDLSTAQPDISDRPALVMRPRLAVEMDRVPRIESKDSSHQLEARVGTETETGVDVRVAYSARGQKVVPLVLARLMNEDRDFQFELARWFFEGRDVVDWQLPSLPRTRLIRDLRIEGRVRLHGLLSPTTAGRGHSPAKGELIDRLLFSEGERAGDLFLGAPTQLVRRMIFENHRIVGRRSLNCRIKTRWFELERSVTSRPTGATLEDIIVNNESLIAAADLSRPEFRQAQAELRSCFVGATLILEPISRAKPKSKPAGPARLGPAGPLGRAPGRPTQGLPPSPSPSAGP